VEESFARKRRNKLDTRKRRNKLDARKRRNKLDTSTIQNPRHSWAPRNAAPYM
jgi:hypothetical protein